MSSCYNTDTSSAMDGAPFVWILDSLSSGFEGNKLFHLVYHDWLGIPSRHAPNGLTVLVFLVFSLYQISISLARRHRRKRAKPKNDQLLLYLQERLVEEEQKVVKKNEIRIFMDGAFDMMHYGHMNAFRLGRSLGTKLIVGINSDESITTCKGAPPLLNDEERLTMVQSCKFVDEVVPGCPYIMTKEYLDYVIEKYKIDYVIHGDDPCIVDGKDVYATAKEAGKYKSIPRTEGVSTTDIVGRMLLMTKEHHYPISNGGSTTAQQSLVGHTSRFLTTSHLLRLFSAGIKAPAPNQKVIYLDGAFDMFHCGHVAMLQAAKEFGDYLIVGVHGDAIVNRVWGQNLPLMNLHERVLSLLGCRLVDDVLIDAPYEITRDMVDSLQIDVVVEFIQEEQQQAPELTNGKKKIHPVAATNQNHEDRLQYARDAGLLRLLRPHNDFTIKNIIERIHDNQAMFQAKYERKMKAEQDFYKTKYGRFDTNGTTNGTANGTTNGNHR